MQAIGWDSTPQEFEGFEKRSLYGAGYIQGSEFGVNVLENIGMLYDTTKRDMDALAKKIKIDKKKRE